MPVCPDTEGRADQFPSVKDPSRLRGQRRGTGRQGVRSAHASGIHGTRIRRRSTTGCPLQNLHFVPVRRHSGQARRQHIDQAMLSQIRGVPLWAGLIGRRPVWLQIHRYPLIPAGNGVRRGACASGVAQQRHPADPATLQKDQQERAYGFADEKGDEEQEIVARQPMGYRDGEQKNGHQVQHDIPQSKYQVFGVDLQRRRLSQTLVVGVNIHGMIPFLMEDFRSIERRDDAHFLTAPHQI